MESLSILPLSHQNLSNFWSMNREDKMKAKSPRKDHDQKVKEVDRKKANVKEQKRVEVNLPPMSQENQEDLDDQKIREDRSIVIQEWVKKSRDVTQGKMIKQEENQEILLKKINEDKKNIALNNAVANNKKPSLLT